MPEIFLQYPIFIRFILPFLLVFFIGFAILEKTKLFGDDRRQLNALVAFVLGLIFVTVLYPTLVVSNLVLFLAVSMVVVFIGLVLWGFLIGGEAKISNDKVKRGFFILIMIALLGAVIWATGLYTDLFNFVSNQVNSTILINALFVVIIAVALALILRNAKGGSGGE